MENFRKIYSQMIWVVSFFNWAVKDIVSNGSLEQWMMIKENIYVYALKKSIDSSVSKDV